jgi:NTE family protein
MTEPRKLGLALGGGSARGKAHIGVLYAFEKAGIAIDAVAGTSAGSIAGALHCFGMSAARIKKWTDTLNWATASVPVWPRRGLISLAGLERRLRALFGSMHFEELPTPFAVGTTDVHTWQAVILRSGPLVPAILASCAVPGIVEPVQIEDRLLCDGGPACNVPVSGARELGAGYVVAVDLMRPSDNTGLGPVAMLKRVMENLVHDSCGELSRADCIIAPDLAKVGYLSWWTTRFAIRQGRDAAETKLGGIRQALGLPE